MKKEHTKAEVARVHESPDVPLVSVTSQALSIGSRYHLPILEAVAAQDQPRALSDHSQNLGGRAQQANSQQAAGVSWKHRRAASIPLCMYALFPPSWSHFLHSASFPQMYSLLCSTALTGTAIDSLPTVPPTHIYTWEPPAGGSSVLSLCTGL